MNQQDRKDAKILIVDDCRVSSLCIKQLLKHIGIDDVDTVHSYQKSIAMCTKKNYNILIVDYHLEQDINGLELFALLKNNHYITPSCSLITLSGDSTIQTVMGVLSMGYGTYICKPVNKKIVEDNVKIAFKKHQLFQKVYDHLENKENNEALKIAIDFCIKNKASNEIELFVIKYLTEHRQHDVLDKLTAHPALSGRVNFIFSEIESKYKEGELSADLVIDGLLSLLKKYVFFVQGFDFLTNVYLTEKHYQKALETAVKALELSPSVTFRALKVARLSASVGDIKAFHLSGLTLAKNLSISESHWSAYVAEFFIYFEIFYKKLKGDKQKEELHAFLVSFSKHCRNKLLEIQIEQFNLLLTIFECRLMVLDNNAYEAKQKITATFLKYYATPTGLTPVVLVDLLSFYYFLGESLPYLLFSKNLVGRDKLNLYCKTNLVMFDDASDATKKMKLLQGYLNKIKSTLLNKKDHNQSRLLYKKILTQYPYNTEACIGFLACNLKLSEERIPELIISIASVTNVTLNDDLSLQRENALNSLHYNEELVRQEIISPTINAKARLDNVENKAALLNIY